MTPVSQPTRHRGVGDHAAGTHDLGQIATGHHGRWLIIDAALEASGAPGLNATQAAMVGKVFSMELLGMYNVGLLNLLLNRC